MIGSVDSGLNKKRKLYLAAALLLALFVVSVLVPAPYSDIVFFATIAWMLVYVYILLAYGAQPDEPLTKS